MDRSLNKIFLLHMFTKVSKPNKILHNFHFIVRRKKHILIIEDKQGIAELLEFNLENNEYKTSIAYNGELGQARDLK